jgi:hypothetical protein
MALIKKSVAELLYKIASIKKGIAISATPFMVIYEVPLSYNDCL